MLGTSRCVQLGEATMILVAEMAHLAHVRLWSADHTLWKPGPTEISTRLGWVSIARTLQGAVPRLIELASAVRSEGIRDVGLLGMRRNGFGLKVLRPTLGSARGYPRVCVPDSTVPRWVRSVAGRIRPDRTPPASVSAYAYDNARAFVYLRIKGEANGPRDWHAKALVRAGHPPVPLDLHDRCDLRAEFLRWEFATVVAGHVLGIRPFAQPNDQESKVNTVRIVREVSASGQFPAVATVGARQTVSRLRSQCSSRSSVRIPAHARPSKVIEAASRKVRPRLMTKAHVAITTGYGPRYLHSSGQVHKEDPPAGLFLHLGEEMKPVLAVPERPYTFGIMAQAQAIKNPQSLGSKGRPHVHVGLGSWPLVTLHRLGTASSSQSRHLRRPRKRSTRTTRPCLRRPR